MVDSTGKTLSIGHTWRASMMALAAKDPYWQAGVRRETADRPQLQTKIEDICSVCHMPMFRTTAIANGQSGEIMRYLEGGFRPDEQELAADGVSCTVCHQIAAENLEEHNSFDGGYVIRSSLPEQSRIYGPHDVGGDLRRVMRSASSMEPQKGAHIQRSELCATCHTLFTPAIDGDGRIIGEFAEQVPYLEWKHSEFAAERDCQSCHMPEVNVPVPISSVLGEPRENVSQHVFRGGNVFMLTLLNKYRDELNVTAPVADLARSVQTTMDYLQSDAARVEITGTNVSGSEALIDISVSNLAGHKLPTAYPSRRAWLHVTVRDHAGRTVFESGAPNGDGSITGNDNDGDPGAYEPHYEAITSSGQVQIYEPIIHDYRDRVTTSLLSGASYAKDNRLLPQGFDKSTADDAISVRGAASYDDDFRAGGDRIQYRVALPDGVASVQVSARLLYQTIGYRWARNLEAYDTYESNRFVGYYKADADASVVVLAEDITE
jgi:hypothetical protein